MLHLYLLSVGPVLDPVVIGCCFPRSIDSSGCRSNGSVAVGPVATGAVVVPGSCGDRLIDSGGGRSSGSVSGVGSIPVAVVPVAPVACGCRSIDSSLSFDHSSGCRSIDSSGCRSSGGSSGCRSIDSGGCCSSGSSAVDRLQWLSFDHLGGCRLITPVCRSITPVAVVQSTPVAVVPVVAPVAVVQSSPVAVVPVAPVAVVPGLKRSITPAPMSPVSAVAQLQYLWLEAPVSVAYLQLQYLWLQWLQYLVLLAAPVSVVPVAGVCRLNASVDIDDYQKRNPVEIVLESTGNSHGIVSNRVHGKHSICW